MSKSAKVFQAVTASLSYAACELQMMQIIDELKEIHKLLERIEEKIDADHESKLLHALESIELYRLSGRNERLNYASNRLGELRLYYNKLWRTPLDIKVIPSKWHFISFLKKGQRMDIANHLTNLTKAQKIFYSKIISEAGFICTLQLLGECKAAENNLCNMKKDIDEFYERIKGRMSYTLNNRLEYSLSALKNSAEKRKLLTSTSSQIFSELVTFSEQSRKTHEFLSKPSVKQIEIKMEV